MPGQKKPLVRQHVPRVKERHGFFARQEQIGIVFELLGARGQARGVHALRLRPFQPVQHRACGPVPVPGERQGAVEIKPDARRAVQQGLLPQFVGKGLAPPAWAPQYVSWTGRCRF